MTNRWLLVATLLLSSAGGAIAEETPRFRIELLDGATHSGYLSWLNDQQVGIAGGQVTPLDGVLTIENTSVPDKQALTRRGVVQLVDGSRLPHEGVTVEDEQLLLTLPAELLASEQAIARVRLSQIRAVRLGQAKKHSAEWERLAAGATDTDLVVVYRGNGQAIRGVPCVVEQVRADEVVVRLEGEQITVPASKVHGFVLATDTKVPGVDSVASPIFVEGAFGRVAARRVWLEQSGRLGVEAVTGFSLSLPLTDVQRIDLSAGRVRWLGELPLVRHTWRPAFGFPAGQAPEYRPPGLLVDRAFDGRPLTIAGTQEIVSRGVTKRFPQTQTFKRGIALRSAGEAVYRLPTGFTRFQAVAGIDPTTAKQGSVMLQLFADERLVYEHTVDGSGPVPISVDLGDATTLRIAVRYGDNLDLGDNLHLGSARVTK